MNRQVTQRLTHTTYHYEIIGRRKLITNKRYRVYLCAKYWFADKGATERKAVLARRSGRYHKVNLKGNTVYIVRVVATGNIFKYTQG